MPSSISHAVAEVFEVYVAAREDHQKPYWPTLQDPPLIGPTTPLRTIFEYRVDLSFLQKR